MLRSHVMRILSHLFTALLSVLETSLKNAILLLSIGGLYANILKYFLFEIVSSKETLSEILVSKSFNIFTIRSFST